IILCSFLVGVTGEAAQSGAVKILPGIKEKGVDLDGDGLVDYLRLSVPVLATSDDYYTFEAVLADAKGRVLKFSSEEHLIVGKRTLDTKFEFGGSPMQNGKFKLKSVTLTNYLDSRISYKGSYTTKFYKVAQKSIKNKIEYSYDTEFQTEASVQDIKDLSIESMSFRREPGYGGQGSDTIIFTVTVKNKANRAIKGPVWLLAGAPGSEEYPGNQFAGASIGDIKPKETRSVMIGGGYLIAANKTLNANLIFYFANSPYSEPSAYNSYKKNVTVPTLNGQKIIVGSGKFTMTLDSSVNYPSSNARGTKGVTLLRLIATAPSQTAVTVRDLSFSNNSEMMGPTPTSDLKNFSLWDGGKKVGATVSQILPTQPGVTPTATFDNLMWKLLPGERKMLTLKADISPTITDSGSRYIGFDGLSTVEYVDFTSDMSSIKTPSFTIK
ncbi:MAG: hypothetical protein WCO03_02710, partial [bacterium]